MSGRDRRAGRASTRQGAVNVPSLPTTPLSEPSPAGLQPKLPAADLLEGLQRAWGWLSRQRGHPLLQPRMRRLQVHETVQLGEKRFVSILRVDGEQFLIGGSPGGISLLAELKPDRPASFEAVLEAERRQVCA